MHKQIEKIKSFEGAPKILKNLFDKNEINKFLELYKTLPTTVHNKKQNVIKKRWLQNYSDELEDLYNSKLKNEIGDFRMDNLKDENNQDILGLFQESYNPIGLHVDAGFNSNEIIYKQTLIPLSSKGSTVIFKNKFYGNSTNFTIDKEELKNFILNDDSYNFMKPISKITEIDYDLSIDIFQNFNNLFIFLNNSSKRKTRKSVAFTDHVEISTSKGKTMKSRMNN